MVKQSSILISGAVEGPVDEAVLRRLLSHVGAMPGPIHGKNGKQHLHQQLKGYNQAAQFNPWVVLVDLDEDEECAPPLRATWLPYPAPHLCFRIAVREIEAWLLADREHLARFLSTAVSQIPQNPEAVDNPKRTMVELATRSRRREIREDMVPRPDSGRQVGPAYTSRLIEFIENTKDGWQPATAAQQSDSLNRCLKCLDRLAGGFK